MLSKQTPLSHRKGGVTGAGCYAFSGRWSGYRKATAEIPQKEGPVTWGPP
ncbi:hypothetical protein LEMLEM_LOCUS13866 [Lemmus lemmus]